VDKKNDDPEKCDVHTHRTLNELGHCESMMGVKRGSERLGNTIR